MMVNVGTDAKPIKNIKMADSVTPTGKLDLVSVFIYIRFRVPQSAGRLRRVSCHISRRSDSGVVGFATHMKIFHRKY